MSEEAGELLRWLADGNYLILGHAAYSANELASPNPRTADGGPQGVLRGRARISPLELLPAFRSGAPLVIFKSPLVSTVRRSVRYDCVTVVTPATGTGKQMVHVFLGLITNAEDGTVARVPGVRRRIGEILLRSGVRADSHTGRLLHGRAAHPAPRRAARGADAAICCGSRNWSPTAPSTAPSGCSRASTSTATSSACWCTSRPTASARRPAAGCSR